MRLFSWGANSYGQLGHGEKSEQCDRPKEVHFDGGDLGEVAHFSGGGGHSVAVGRRGQLWACGWNAKGQLGLGHRRDAVQFEAVNSAPVIVAASCGWDFTVVVDDTGLAHGCGSNVFGQLGVREGDENSAVFATTDRFMPIPGLSDVTSVACGLRHTVFLDSSGRIFGCGSNKKCQLSGAKCNNLANPVQVRIPGDVSVTQIAAGQYYTLALAKDGRLYGFGDNKHGQLCGLERGTIATPTALILDSPVQKFEAGWTHVACLMADDRVATFGRNNYFQLGRSESLSMGVDNGRRFRDICSGSEHCLAVDGESGTLMSWGWNEHGNCGNGSTVNVPSPAAVPLPTSAKILRLYAASAHNFVLIHL